MDRLQFVVVGCTNWSCTPLSDIGKTDPLKCPVTHENRAHHMVIP